MKLIAIAYLVIAQLSSAQRLPADGLLPQDTLASIGGRIINAKDYLERFELMPWPQKENKARQEYTKKEFLYSLIAEKLLALEASTYQIGSDSVSLGIQNNLQSMFVRDELYKQEVTPNVKISADEIRSGMTRFAYEVEVEILGIISKEEGDLFYKKYKQSKNKKFALKKYRDSLFVPIDTVQVSFGSADRPLEEAAYEIDTDSISKPVESRVYGWVMLRLLKKYTNPQFAKLSGSDQLQRVRKIIGDRKEDSLASRTFAAITSPHRAEANAEIFYLLADTVHARLSADSNSYKTKNVYMLPVALMDEIDKTLGVLRDSIFVTFDEGEPMTVAQILSGLRNNYVVFPNLQIDYVRWVLNNNIKTVIQNELLAREGFRKNLQQSENVRHDLSTWMDNRKGMLLLRRIVDSVTVRENEIEEEYRKNPAAYGATVEVKIQEVLVDSMPLAVALRNRLNQQEDFSAIAKKYSKRKRWMDRGGISEYVDCKTLGDLGEIAAVAPIGELQGPRKINDGISVFKVIDRRITDDSLRRNFEETAGKIRNRILQQKRQKTLDQYIGTLARKYNVTINEAALKNVATTSHSMVTWRNIGFGGRIVAVPQVNRQSEWIYEWQRQILLNQ